MVASYRIGVAMIVAILVAGCSSSSGASHRAVGRSSGRTPDATFCELFRRDANDGRLRNWNLTENGKTAAYVGTLRALANAAPAHLKSDIDRVLTYYASSNPSMSTADDLASLQSGQRVLDYVEHTCGIDTTSSPPPGDSGTAPSLP